MSNDVKSVLFHAQDADTSTDLIVRLALLTFPMIYFSVDANF